jgi:hypothetical protein
MSMAIITSLGPPIKAGQLGREASQPLLGCSAQAEWSCKGLTAASGSGNAALVFDAQAVCDASHAL